MATKGANPDTSSSSSSSKISSSSSKTVKQTSNSSSSGIKSESGGGAFVRQQKPIASVKTVVINRSSRASYDSVDSVSAKRVGRSHAAPPPSMVHGSAPDVSGMLTGRQKEKQQMQELNERFASYIEKVRFLEAQNRKQGAELQQLRDSWGKETERVKQLYETEMQQLRKMLQEADQYKAEAEVRTSSLDDQLNELQQLLDETNRQHQADREANTKLSAQMAEYDGEISLLRRRAAAFDEERARDQAEIQRLRKDVARLRADLDAETLQHINAENEAMSLREELEFLRAVHESELKELSALAYRDTTSENREFWKNEMAQALHEIQREFDSKLETVRTEVESQYSIRVQEARTSSTRDNMELAHLKEENKRIKSQIGDTRSRIPELEARNSQLERELEDLRREMEEAERDCEMQKGQLRTDLAGCNATLEEYLREMQSLMDTKISLELEIHAYRKLLEGEEIRINQSTSSERSVEQKSSTTTEQTTATQKQKSKKSKQEQQQAQQQMSVIKGEMSSKTNFERSAKGNVTIQECGVDGSFVMLENTGKKKEDLSGWSLKRDIENGKEMYMHQFAEASVLEPGTDKAMKIWAKGQKPADSKDPEAEVETWGVGNTVVTSLTNADGDERATHKQTTTFSSD